MIVLPPRATRSMFSLVVLASFGCAGGAPDRELTLTSSREFEPNDYREVLDRWTRDDRLYDGIQSRLFVNATFISPEFRKAFLSKHESIFGRGSEEAARIALTVGDEEERLSFFFSAFTPDYRWNDFAKPDSIWRVSLVNDTGAEVTGEISKLKSNANLRAIYPYITDFAFTYSLRFPLKDALGQSLISPSTRWFELRFRSSLGQSVLRWELAPYGPGPGISQTKSSRRKIVSEGESWAASDG